VSRGKYEEYAAKCLLLADKVTLPAIKLGLIDMAHGWLRLAEQAERNTPDLAYDIPPPPDDVP
jgi:hypothetical protein